MIKNNYLKLRRLIPKILLQAWQITHTSERKLEHMVWVKNKLAVFNTHSRLKMASAVSCTYMLLSCTNLTLRISGNQWTPTTTPVPENPSRIASTFGLPTEIANISCNHFCPSYEKKPSSVCLFFIWFRPERRLPMIKPIFLTESESSSQGMSTFSGTSRRCSPQHRALHIAEGHLESPLCRLSF